MFIQTALCATDGHASALKILSQSSSARCLQLCRTTNNCKLVALKHCRNDADAAVQLPKISAHCTAFEPTAALPQAWQVTMPSMLAALMGRNHPFFIDGIQMSCFTEHIFTRLTRRRDRLSLPLHLASRSLSTFNCGRDKGASIKAVSVISMQAHENQRSISQCNSAAVSPFVSGILNEL